MGRDRAGRPRLIQHGPTVPGRAIADAGLAGLLATPISNIRGRIMRFAARLASFAACAVCIALATPAMAQKSGGILKLYHRDSPASLSTHEEATVSAIAPAMAIFNNLVLFDQHEKQNRPEFIRPELADSWSW